MVRHQSTSSIHNYLHNDQQDCCCAKCAEERMNGLDCSGNVALHGHKLTNIMMLQLQNTITSRLNGQNDIIRDCALTEDYQINR